MPSREALDSMCMETLGVRWEAITNPEWRVKMMQLTLHDERNALLDAISGDLSDILKQATQTNEHLDCFTDQMIEVSSWFEHSKVWDGETYVKQS